MKKNSVIFLTSVISVIFALSLFYFGFNIYRENKNARYSSEQKFNELFNFFKNDIKNASLENSTINFSDFKFILIEKNSSKIEAYPDFNIDLSKEENSHFSRTFSKKIYTHSDVYTISAAVYTLSPETVVHYGKKSFLLILFTTVITMILAILVKNTKTFEKTENLKNDFSEKETDELFSKEENENSKQSLSNNENSDEKISLEKEESEQKEEMLKEEVPETKEIPEKNEGSKEYSEIENTFERECENQKNSYKNLYESTILPYEENNITFSQNENDLYSENSGFVKNEFLQSCLKNELEKCGSCELDLTLILIKINGLIYTDDAVSNIKTTLLNFFQFKEQIFEYLNEGFAVICPNVSIENAENICEKLLYNLKNDVKESGLNEISIGLSSRANRVISSERLINEAHEALLKAEEDSDSKIIGFHIDIQKYREFLRENA